MKFLKFSFIFTVLLLVLTCTIVSAEEVVVQNHLAGVSSQEVRLETPVKRGLYYISFDMYAEDDSADVYCRLIGNDGSFTNPSNTYLFDAAAFKRWYSKPTFTVFGDMYCDWHMQIPADSKVEYNQNQWYQVDIWLDFSKRISTVYLNGEYFDTCKMNEDLTSLYGFAFYCDVTYVSDKTKPYFKYRDLAYGEVSGNYITEDIPGVTIPEYLTEPIDASIITNKSGNIYFTPENVTFDVGLKNKTKENKSYNVSYEVFNEGKSIWKSSEIVDIQKGRTKSRNVVVDLTQTPVQYGFFDMKVVLTDVNTEEVIERETRFSVAKKADKVNNKVGLNNHYSKRIYEKGMDAGISLFHAAGFGAERDGLAWSNYEWPLGEYNMVDKMDKWLDEAKEDNVTAVAVLGYQNDNYKNLYPNNEVAAPPVSGEYMEKWKLYVENIVRDTIDRVGYYEVWNEWNLSYNNNGKEHYTYHPAEDYVNLVKVTYEIIDKINKEKGTNAKVLAGALGYNSGDGTDDFIKECIELGMGNYCDGISCHPYWAHENPEDNNYYSSLIAVRTIREALDNKGLDHIEIVATELGYPTRENGSVTETDQAKWMVRSSAYYEGEIDLITWYVGQEKIDNNETENSFGIIRGWTGTEIPYEAKPAYIALANYNSLMAGAELISRSPEIDERYEDGAYVNNEQYTYHFKNNGKDIYMLVTMSKKGGTLKLETGKAGIAELIDMYGNGSMIGSDANGVYTVSVANDEPVYIVTAAQSITQSEGEEILNVYGYADGYVLREDGNDDIVLQNGQETEYVAELSKTPVKSGIVDVSFRFWPNISSTSSSAAYQAIQTFDFGGGFSFDAKWKPHGASAWMIGGHFDLGEKGTKFMNTDRWGTSEAGWFRQKGANASAPHAYFDISARIDLDAKKIYLTVIENLETASEKRERYILRDEPFDYNADSFDYCKSIFKTVDTGNNDALINELTMQSLNSGLKVQAGKGASGEKVVSEIEYIYSDGYVFRCDSKDDIKINSGEDYSVDLKETPVSEGIVDVSFRFWPNMKASPDYKEARQTFEFGDGFSFNAIWRSYGGNASWIYKGWLETSSSDWKWMNETAWGADYENLGPGCIRTKGANTDSPHAYYDISAKINLDTKKIYLTVVETLETKTETKTSVLWNNREFDYNADVFDGYRTSLKTVKVSTTEAVEDTYLHSLNSNLLIRADGATSYRVGDAEQTESDKVVVRSGDDEVTSFAQFIGVDKPVASVAFENVTEDGVNAVLVVAYYKNNVLVKLETIRNIMADGGYDNVIYKYNFAKSDIDADSVKVFVWNDITGITPVKETAWLK